MNIKKHTKVIKLSGKDKIEDIFEQIKCTICLEEFTNTTENLIKLLCGHIFDQDCIAQSLLSKDTENNLYKNKCPNCNEVLKEDFVEKYFLSLINKKRDNKEFIQQLLFYAATKASVNILKELFKKNSGVQVDVNAKIDAMSYYISNETGQHVEMREKKYTPLHFAANQSNKDSDNHEKRSEVIKILLLNGADFNAENSRGLRPIELIINKDSEVYEKFHKLYYSFIVKKARIIKH